MGRMTKDDTERELGIELHELMYIQAHVQVGLGEVFTAYRSEVSNYLRCSYSFAVCSEPYCSYNFALRFQFLNYHDFLPDLIARKKVLLGSYPIYQMKCYIRGHWLGDILDIFISRCHIKSRRIEYLDRWPSYNSLCSSERQNPRLSLFRRRANNPTNNHSNIVVGQIVDRLQRLKSASTS